VTNAATVDAVVIDRLLHARHDTPKKDTIARGRYIAWAGVGARQTADLAELKDWVEGIRAAAHKARQEGNLSLAEALDMTRFEVYESYLDEEYISKRAKRLVGRRA
jgi:hypothetical protein